VARAWIVNNMITDYEDMYFVLLQFDPGEGTPASAVFNELGNCGYEGDKSFDIAATDAWVERTLQGTTLLLDLVAYPRIIEGAGLDPASFTERAQRDADALRVLRVACDVDPAEYAKAHEGTFIWTAPDGTSLEEIRASIEQDENWPLSFNVLMGVSAGVSVEDDE
jgi:hypothetical protein